jgi:hypothetical protein
MDFGTVHIEMAIILFSLGLLAGLAIASIFQAMEDKKRANRELQKALADLERIKAKNTDDTPIPPSYALGS